MEVIPVALSVSDFLPAIATLVAFVIIGASLSWLDRDPLFLCLFIVVGIIVAIVMAAFLTGHHIASQKVAITEKFEEVYDLTIVQGEIPFTEEESPEAVVAYLNDVAGAQTVLVDIEDGTYVVSVDGEIREVQND